MTDLQSLIAAIAAVPEANKPSPCRSKKNAEAVLTANTSTYLHGVLADLRKNRLANGLYAMPEWVFKIYFPDDSEGPDKVFVSTGGAHSEVVIPRTDDLTLAAKRDSAFMQFNQLMAELDAEQQPLTDRTRQAVKVMDVRRDARIATYEAVSNGYTP